MDMRFARINSLKRLESLSLDNVQKRLVEEKERIPLEADAAEIDELKRALISGGNPPGSEVTAKIEDEEAKVQEKLERLNKKRRQLLAEKSFLMAETHKRRAAARAAGRKAGAVKLNMKNRSALRKIEYDAARDARRMDDNIRLLTKYDARNDIANARRHRLHKLMGCDQYSAMKYEIGLGEAMLRAGRSYFPQAHEKTASLEDGIAEPSRDDGRVTFREISVKNIATPIQETNYGIRDRRVIGCMTLMEHIPEIIPMIREGKQISEILNDVKLKEHASALITQEFPVTVTQIAGVGAINRYQASNAESQRRIVVARLFGAGVVRAKVETAVK
jgi:hypothetical protein